MSRIKSRRPSARETSLRVIEGSAKESPPTSLDEKEPDRLRPGIGYFRRAIHDAYTVDQVRELALTLCTELERNYEWAAKNGIRLPRWFAIPDEVADKGLEIAK